MADIVTTIGQAAHGNINAVAGGLQAQALGTGVAGVPSDLIQGVLGSGTNRSLTGIYDTFLSNVLQQYTNALSIMPLWICYFDDLPITGADVEAYDINGGGKHVLADPQKAGIASASSGRIGAGGKGMLFCQGVLTPSDSNDISRDSYTNVGGFIPGLLGTGRRLNEISITFIDTNNSFVDLILRPWTIYNGYHGIPFAHKTEITIEQYTKNGPGNDLRLRKKFKLHNAFPSQIDSERLSYQDTNDYRQILFQYDAYVLEGSDTFSLGNRLVDSLVEYGANLVQDFTDKAISSLISNVSFEIDPALNSGLNIVTNQNVSIPKNSTPAGSDVANNSQIVSPIKSPAKTKYQSVTNITADVPNVPDLVANHLQLQNIPDDDLIKITEIEGVKTGKTSNIVQVPNEDHIMDSVIATPYRAIIPPMDDTPMYKPYAEPSPHVRPPKRDVYEPGVTIPVKIKNVASNDAVDTNSIIKTQQISTGGKDRIDGKADVKTNSITTPTNDSRIQDSVIVAQNVVVPIKDIID